MTENDGLAVALEHAAKEPAEAPEFYRRLMAATVFIVGESETQVIAPGAKVRIEGATDPQGVQFIPFFSSLEKLRGFFTDAPRHLSLPARSLFELVRGERLVLNPGASFGKELLPAEIEHLLANNSGGQKRIVQGPTSVVLGQPSNYPSALVESLSMLFAKSTNVRAGYLALMHDPASGEPPHLLVGIDAADFELAARDAGIVALAAMTREPVDIVQVRPGEEGPARYFIENTPPFYRR